MTDQNISANVASTPASDTASSVDADFDAGWAAFTGLDMEAAQREEQGSQEDNATSGENAAPTPTPTTQAPQAVSAPTAQPTIQTSTPAANGTQAPAAPAEGEQDAVDPALLAAVLMPGHAPASQPQPSTQPQTPPTQAATEEEGKPWFPIDPTGVQLPPQLVQTLFNSEDPNQQTQALVQIMASWGNALASMMDQRVREHYQPRFLESATRQYQEQHQAAAVAQDFYGAFEDLRQFPQVVANVARAMHQQNPDLKYDPKARDAIGRTAREVISRMGLTKTAPAPASASPQPAPAPAATPAVFDGMARPAPSGPAQTQEFGPELMADLVW